MADETFKEFVMDQINAIPELRAKSMFGGHGIYQGDTFFAILMEGRLYFRTNEETRPEYLKRGMAPFIYEKARQTTAMAYFEVPPDVLEDRVQLAEWARQAIQASQARAKPRRRRG